MLYKIELNWEYMTLFILEIDGIDTMKKLLYSCLFLLFSILLFGCTTDTPSYEVTFDQIIDNAPSVETQIIKENQIVIQPTYIESIIYHDLTYQFDGWFVEDVPFDFSTEITSDIHLEARWSRIETFSGLLLDYSDTEYVIQHYDVFIVQISGILETLHTELPALENITKVSIDVKETILGTVEQNYLLIYGGEEEHNIYVYFELYPKEITIGGYFLVINRKLTSNNAYENAGKYGAAIAGHGIIELIDFDPNASLLEQDESVLEIIQPYMMLSTIENNILIIIN